MSVHNEAGAKQGGFLGVESSQQTVKFAQGPSGEGFGIP